MPILLQRKYGVTMQMSVGWGVNSLQPVSHFISQGPVNDFPYSRVTKARKDAYFIG